MHIFHYSKEAVETKDLKPPKDGFVWVDCVNITKADAEQLQAAFGIHPLTTEDLINHNVRVKIEEFPDHLFCIFYGLTAQAEPEEVDFILGKNFLITNHKSELEITKLLKEEPDRLNRNCAKGLDMLMHRILDAQIDNCFITLEKVGEKVDALEAKAARSTNKDFLTEIYAMKRKLGRLKRLMFAQREKANMLAKNVHGALRASSLPYYRDIYDNCVHVSDAVDNYKEEAANAFEVYMSAVSNNMNQVMKVLSIIATITLPLTVISGIYGTNFANLPGMHTYNGFWYMLAGMALLSVVMIMLFRSRKWL